MAKRKQKRSTRHDLMLEAVKVLERLGAYDDKDAEEYDRWGGILAGRMVGMRPEVRDELEPIVEPEDMFDGIGGGHGLPAILLAVLLGLANVASASQFLAGTSYQHRVPANAGFAYVDYKLIVDNGQVVDGLIATGNSCDDCPGTELHNPRTVETMDGFDVYRWPFSGQLVPTHGGTLLNPVADWRTTGMDEYGNVRVFGADEHSLYFGDAVLPITSRYQQFYEPGDASPDGLFNSSDLVQVMAAGRYELGLEANWFQGDWNADRLADSSDLVLALAGGHYEELPDWSQVPEPCGPAMLLIGFLGFFRWGYER